LGLRSPLSSGVARLLGIVNGELLADGGLLGALTTLAPAGSGTLGRLPSCETSLHRASPDER
jgi:hypothetical protein